MVRVRRRNVVEALKILRGPKAPDKEEGNRQIIISYNKYQKI